ncbi:hypothetical protein RUND412_000638 [Rhizina undulata]
MMAPSQSSANPNHKAEDSSNSRLPRSTSPTPDTGVLSSLANSATTLLRSISTPTPSVATDYLNSSSSSAKGGSREQSSTSSSSTWAESSITGPSTSTSSASAELSFRSQQLPSSSTAESEFSTFGQSVPILEEAVLSSGVTTTWNNGSHTYHSQEPDGQAVFNLLLTPLADEIYALPPELPRIDITQPIVRSFVACDDPVEFLSNTIEYTEEVWGDLIGLVREAREEIAQNDGKGKGKEGTNDKGPAVERLRQIWGHLRTSKL